jgi:release factor glutamine methyltransferase
MLIEKPETIQEVLVSATRALGVTRPYREARLEAEMLLAHTLGVSRAGLLARLGDPIEPEVAAQFAARVARRAQYEPLAYILGCKQFFGYEFVVDRRVLIPRFESELLVQVALERLAHYPRPAPRLADIGTGSGALALALAKHAATAAEIIATDISPDALAVAAINARLLGLENRVAFFEGDLLEPLRAPVDILIANLPYIPTPRYPHLPREIRDYEPRVALDGGIDGLEPLRRLLARVDGHVARGGIMLFEISEEQGASVLDFARTLFPFAAIRLHQDWEGLDRVMEIRT